MSKIGNVVIDAMERDSNGDFEFAERVLKQTARKLDLEQSHQNKNIVPERIEDIKSTKKFNDIKALSRCVKDFAETNHQVVHYNGKNYVKSSVWQFLADMLGVSIRHISCDYDTYMYNAYKAEDSDGSKVNFLVQCGCSIVDSDGRTVSYGESFASNDEEFLSHKELVHTLHLAQTRAFVRAMRNKYSHIVVMAGYEPAPFEEVMNDNFRDLVNREVKRALANNTVNSK